MWGIAKGIDVEDFLCFHTDFPLISFIFLLWQSEIHVLKILILRKKLIFVPDDRLSLTLCGIYSFAGCTDGF